MCITSLDRQRSSAQVTAMTATLITAPAVPLFPLSIFDPVHLGIDENGEQVHVDLAERNMLVGGEPAGGGKSNALNLITAHGALSGDCKLILIDGKQVELGMWRHCADEFIGPSITDAIAAFTQFPADHEPALPAAAGRWPAQDHPWHGRAGVPGRHR